MRGVQYTILLFLIHNCVEGQQAEDNSEEIGTRIVGGSDAQDSAFPFLVSIQQNRAHICGGSILNNQWILTAAHCLVGKPASQMFVVAGTNYLDGSGRRYSVQRLILHPAYNSARVANDIGLMKLNQIISFSDKIKTIRIPQQDTPGGRQLTLVGWGKTTFPGQVSTTLKAINLISITNAECRNSYSQVTSGNICTKGDRGRGACQGDSGGPLLEGSTQVGVVSYGVPCAVGSPDVFTRVYSYRGWIRSNTN